MKSARVLPGGLLGVGGVRRFGGGGLGVVQVNILYGKD